MIPTISNPNLSIIAPGPCNMKCGFCFWERDPGEMNDLTSYMAKLSECLKKLPPQFTQVSITGGEPTLCSIIDEILSEIGASGRFNKVVLTTNGTKLQELINGGSLRFVTNINISRHSIYNVVNNVVFGINPNAEILPSIVELGLLNVQLNRLGIETCCNAVIGIATEPVSDFIAGMRLAGFTETTFRKQHTSDSNLSPTDYEFSVAHHKIIAHSECPVCRSDLRIINGMKTWWTASIAEPSDVMTDKVYEAVFHPDGKLYADWSKNIEIEL